MNFHGQSIYGQYGFISKLFSQYAAEIQLAEPIVTNHQNEDHVLISWYAETSEEPKRIPETQKRQIYQRIEVALNNLFNDLSEDPSQKSLIEAVLHIQDEKDILVSNAKIFIKNWGSPVSQEDGHSQVYIPSLIPVPSDTKQEATTPVSEEKVENDESSLPKKTPEPIRTEKQGSSVFLNMANVNKYRFLSQLIAAIIFFFIGLLLGWRIIFAEHPLKVKGLLLQDAQNLVQQNPEVKRRNQELDHEINILRDKLKNPPCDLKESRADPSLNNSLEHPYTPMTSNGKAFQGSLPELLEKSTVFIMALEEDNATVASGTGFFVTPDTIVTNRHVVENAKRDSIMVTNKSLGQLKLAHIISVSQSSEIGGLDLAVLKVDNAPPQQPLSFSLEAQPLQDVVAAGYPGIMMSQDDAMQRLLKGDLKAIPGVILTKGQINGIQSNHEGEKIMPHSAMVSPGNSGGPLVDLCGRVVGINTFVTMDQDTSSHGNYAQKSDLIVQVLQASKIPIQVQSGTCRPEAATETKKQPDDRTSATALQGSNSNQSVPDLKTPNKEQSK